MQDRAYSEMKTFTHDYRRIGEDGVRKWKPKDGEYVDTAQITDAALRHKIEARIAVHVAHQEYIEQIVSRLSLGNSLLCVCDKSITDDLIEWIGIELKSRKHKIERVRSLPSQEEGLKENHDNRNNIENMVGGLYEQLSYLDSQEDQATVLVIDHLDLMTTNLDGSAMSVANDIVYWLNIYTGTPVLAFADPELPLRKVIENIFSEKITIPPFKREDLFRLLRPEEAEKISFSKFKIPDQIRLYQYISGLSIKRLRWLMRLIHDKFPTLGGDGENAEQVYEYIRQLTTAGNIQVPSVSEDHIAGYVSTKAEIKKRVIFPMQYRETATNVEELSRADAMIPKGVILHGPPRNGKTEIAKWIATELHYPLITIRGPELKNMYLGETERAIRRTFAQTRRCAPSVLLIDEIDALTPQRNELSSGADISMVSMFLTEMDGLNSDEAVLILGTTNRLVAVDPAFKGPGRFGILVEIDYPGNEDRLAILRHYRKLYNLTEWLNDESLIHLQQQTVGSLRGGHGQDGTLWSCDHLRGICQALLVEIEWARSNKLPLEVNDKAFLNEILKKVSGSLESAPEPYLSDWRKV